MDALGLAGKKGLISRWTLHIAERTSEVGGLIAMVGEREIQKSPCYQCGLMSSKLQSNNLPTTPREFPHCN